MSFNLLDSVEKYFSEEFVNQASTNWGDSHAGISKALSAIIPAGLAGIVHKATASPDGANNIFDMARDASPALPSSPNYNNLSSTSPAAGNTLYNLFGGNHTGIVSMITRFAGIKESSVSSLMSLALPVILGVVGKHAEQNKLSPPGLSQFLTAQQDTVIRALPTGLSSMLPMLGLGTTGSALSSTGAAKTAAASRKAEDRNMPPGTKWLFLLILLVAGLALLWYFMKNRRQKESMPATTDTLASSPTTGITTPGTIIVN